MKDVMDEDTALMLSFKEGNEASFRELMKRYYQKMLNFAYRFTHDPQTSEDMAQEIFFKIYSAKKAYTPEAKFSTFLYRVATNHCLNEIRKPAYGKEFISIHKNPDEGRGHNPGDIHDKNARRPEEIFSGRILINQIYEALMKLPERQRIAFILVKYDGLSFAEAAQAMETTASAVKALLNRCRETLVELLNPCLEKWGNEYEMQ
jgi:RNA polymerase sigma-70 factor (ECF subfamily)